MLFAGIRQTDMIMCTINDRSYGENVVYTDWKKDNYFRSIKVPSLFTVNRYLHN